MDSLVAEAVEVLIDIVPTTCIKLRLITDHQTMVVAVLAPVQEKVVKQLLMYLQLIKWTELTALVVEAEARLKIMRTLNPVEQDQAAEDLEQ